MFLNAAEGMPSRQKDSGLNTPRTVRPIPTDHIPCLSAVKNNFSGKFKSCMSSSYLTVGPENPITPGSIDPIQFCVGNIFFTPEGIDGAQLDRTFCPLFMGQRCAKSWDAYCDAYLTGSKYDSGGFLHTNKQFLSETAKKKYCRMSSAPGTHCAKQCQAFIPQGQSSVQICDQMGTMNWLDTKDEYDLAGDFPQSARLNPISPLYMSYCPEVCDASNPMPPDVLGPNDPVLNYCIQHGTCEQVLMDLAYNLVANNQQGRVTNPAFQKIIAAAKEDYPVNPNVIAKIATTYGLPAQTALEVLRDATIGGISGEVQPGVFSIVQPPGSAVVEIPGSSPVSATMKSMPPVASHPKTGIVVSPTSKAKGVVSSTKPKGVVSPTSIHATTNKPPMKHMRGSGTKEGFYKQSVSTKNIVVGIAFVLLLLVIVWVILKSKQ